MSYKTSKDKRIRDRTKSVLVLIGIIIGFTTAIIGLERTLISLLALFFSGYIAYLAWKKPFYALIFLIIYIPFNQIIQSLLEKLIPHSHILKIIPFLKDILLIYLISRALYIWINSKDKNDKHVKMIIIFLALMIIMTFVSYIIYGNLLSIIYSSRIRLEITLSFFIGLILKKDEISRVVDFFIGTGVLLSIVNLAAFFFLNLGFRSRPGGLGAPSYRLDGLQGATGVNTFGLYLVLILIFIFLKIIYSRNKFIYYFAIIPVFIALLLTFSRRSWLALIFGAIILTIILRSKKMLYILSYGALLSLLFGFNRIYARISIIFGKSLGARFAEWKIIFQNMGYKILLGGNIGMFGPAAVKLGVFESSPVHNEFILLLLETGLVGLLLFLTIILTIIRTSLNIYLSKRYNSTSLIISLFLIPTWIIMLFASLFGTNISTFLIGVPLWIFSGSIFALKK